jgi:hypothetical protein
MAISTVDGPMLLIKKLGGLMFVFVGCLGTAIGFETGSTGLIATGIVALAFGASLSCSKLFDVMLADSLRRSSSTGAPRRCPAFIAFRSATGRRAGNRSFG